MEQPWGAVPLPYGGAQTTPPKKKSNALLITIIVVLVVLVVGGSGGFALYQSTRPKPIITVTSKYLDGSTPVGATSTDGFTIKGTNFTHSSAITFYADGKAVPSDKPVLSDANGAVTGTLAVGPTWTPGFHNLTAKDADGYTTKLTVKVEIVVAGKNNTPGPNGAPTDAANMIVTAAITSGGSSSTATLTVKNGSVCSSEDDGQPHSTNQTTSDGTAYVATIVQACSGTYVSGKLTYTETVSVFKIVYANGINCSVSKPFVSRHLEGSFSNGTTVSGTYSADTITLDCDHGLGSVPIAAENGTWTGLAVVS